MIGGIGLPELSLLFVFIVIPLLWIYSLIDILKNEFTGSNKMIWFLAVLLLPILGMALYFFIGRNQKVLIDKT